MYSGKLNLFWFPFNINFANNYNISFINWLHNILTTANTDTIELSNSTIYDIWVDINKNILNEEHIC